MKETLYKRNNNGIPIKWEISNIDNTIAIVYGSMLTKNFIHDVFNSDRKDEEVKSRIKQKRKEGYKSLADLYDSAPDTINNQNDLYKYLSTFLPRFNTDSNGFMKPMLAKTYNEKVFKDGGRIGQWKINGLRCTVSANANSSNMFNPINLIFTSREGIKWNLKYMEEYLLTIIPKELLERMIDDSLCLDGEIYLPNYKVNEINHIVKDPTCKEHKLLQLWCYDLAVEGISQMGRFEILNKAFFNERILMNSRVRDSKFISEFHLNNKNKFVLLPNYDINNDGDALFYRTMFVSSGFEGIILRSPDAEYQFGKRNSTMFKYKPINDGLFKIIDIIPEGTKRNTLPKFILENDINDGTFECTMKGSFDEQGVYLKNKDSYIGKQAFVEYRERIGELFLPFHAKIDHIDGNKC